MMETAMGSLTMEVAMKSLVVVEPCDGGGDGKAKLVLDDDEGTLEADGW